MRFKELGPPRMIAQVRLEEGPVCWVTGWCDDVKNPICPAYVQKVEESGMGRAHLIYGGNWGIRLKPVHLKEDWGLHHPEQWGEPFLLLSDPSAIVFADENH